MYISFPNVCVLPGIFAPLPLPCLHVLPGITGDFKCVGHSHNRNHDNWCFAKTTDIPPCVMMITLYFLFFIILLQYFLPTGLHLNASVPSRVYTNAVIYDSYLFVLWENRIIAFLTHQFILPYQFWFCHDLSHWYILTDKVDIIFL